MNPSSRKLVVFPVLALVLIFLCDGRLAAQPPGPPEDPGAAEAADRARNAGTAKTAPRPNRGGDSAEVVAAAVAKLTPIPPGPFHPTWDSLKENFRTPEWFRDAKFGLMMHWGVYSVPAHGSEWYVRYMYDRKNTAFVKWHTEHYGPPEKFGYKDFIPLYTAAKWDPEAWAQLFKRAGAKYVIASGEHHDGFSNWDSAINKFNAKNMGPKRDLVGELTAAVRKAGLKTGVANHSNNHFTFVTPLEGSDQFDPAWAAFYSVADRSEPARVRFLETWVAKNLELVDKYQPDMLWFDMNGGDRSWDPLKLHLAAYYYNRAAEWGKEVAISTKGEAYLAGFVMDYERQGRAPKVLTDYVWQPDDPIGEKFGYVEGMPLKPAGGLVRNLIINVSRNGNLLLNISPKADGTIPEAQVNILLAIGKWLEVNGEAIYGTRPWKISEEGHVAFTTKSEALYAISLEWPAGGLVIPALGKNKGNVGSIEKVELLGHSGCLEFKQEANAFNVSLPAEKPCDFAYAFKVTWSKTK